MPLPHPGAPRVLRSTRLASPAPLAPKLYGRHHVFVGELAGLPAWPHRPSCGFAAPELLVRYRTWRQQTGEYAERGCHNGNNHLGCLAVLNQVVEQPRPTD